KGSWGPIAGISASVIGHQSASLRWHELPRFSADPKVIQRQSSNTIAQFALDFERKGSVCGHGHQARPVLAETICQVLARRTLSPLPMLLPFSFLPSRLLAST